MPNTGYKEEWERRMAERDREAKERKKENKKTLRTICMMLSRHRIKKVVISYDGQGDSGCIGDIHLFDDKLPLNDDAINNLELTKYTRKEYNWKLQQGAGSCQRTFQEEEVECSVISKLEDIAYDYLPCGWEINEGSYGELVIHVEDGVIEHEHNTRVESIETESQTHEI